MDILSSVKQKKNAFLLFLLREILYYASVLNFCFGL